MSDAQAGWERLIGQWLELKSGRSQSEHTRRNYAEALGRWRAFLAHLEPPVALWEADASHVRAWQAGLRAEGLKESTVNHKLACVSSLYSFAQGERHVGGDGVERPFFVDAAGKARANPFRAGNVVRGRVENYGRAHPLTAAEAGLLLGHLEREAGSPAGARNYALILTFLYTGWRSAELLRMRWGDVRPHRSEAGTWVYAWRGKGAKAQDDVLPGLCWAAICAFLKSAGRLLPERGIEPGREEFVWLPVERPEMEGMRHGAQVAAGRPISERQALRVLRAALRGAGIREAERVRIHDLRHSHALLLVEAGVPESRIQQRLHHESLGTTGRYLRTIVRDDPADDVTRAFAQLRLRVETDRDRG